MVVPAILDPGVARALERLGRLLGGERRDEDGGRAEERRVDRGSRMKIVVVMWTGWETVLRRLGTLLAMEG